jgi:O-antigen ligase
MDASSMACLGVSGYLIGLALPLFPALDVPLVFLVLLASAAVVVSQHVPGLGHFLATVPLLAFVVARVLSAVAAPDALRSLQIVAPLLPALLLFFALSELVRARRHVLAVYVSLTAAGLVLSATFLVTAWLSTGTSADGWALAAPSALLVVKNDLTVVAVLAPLALAAASLSGHWIVRLLAGGFIVALVSVIGVVQSRTALVTAVVAVGCFVVLTRGRLPRGGARKIWWLIGGAAAAVVLFDALAGFQLAGKVVHDWQGNGRLALWAAALAMFQDAPLLGHGPHGFVLHYRAYLDVLDLPSWVRIDPRVTPWAHNLYLELLAEQGVLGLCSFLTLAAAAIVMLGRAIRSREPDVQRLGAGVGAALIAFLAAGFFELSFLRAWVTIVFFTLFGLLATITRAEREGEA